LSPRANWLREQCLPGATLNARCLMFRYGKLDAEGAGTFVTLTQTTVTVTRTIGLTSGVNATVPGQETIWTRTATETVTVTEACALLDLYLFPS
jgi:hypothetical protein